MQNKTLKHAKLPKVNFSFSSAALIFVGDELLSGKQENTTATPLASFIKKASLPVSAIHTVGDDCKGIANCIKNCDASVVIISGGLGPTADDITLQAAALAFNVSLKLNESHATFLKKFFSAQKLTSNNLDKQKLISKKAKTDLNISLKTRITRQASIPNGAIAISHSYGTAPLVFYSSNKKIHIFIAGVPYESINLMQHYIYPWLKKKSGNKSYCYSITVFKEIESRLENEVQLLAKKLGFVLPGLSTSGTEKKQNKKVEISVSYLPKGGRTVQISFSGSKSKVDSFVKSIVKHFIENLNVLVYKGSFTAEEKLHEIFLEISKKNILKVGFVESCTGGMLSQMLTQFSGASNYFYGSAVTYMNHAKEEMVQVSKKTLQNFGDVSEQVVLQMAQGMLKKLQEVTPIKNNHLYVAASISGVAGPDGGSKQKPVGTVCIAVAVKGVMGKKVINSVNNKTYSINGSRSLVRLNACKSALVQLLSLLESNELVKRKAT